MTSAEERDRRLTLLDRSPDDAGAPGPGTVGRPAHRTGPAWARVSAYPAVGVDEDHPSIVTERLSLESSAGTLGAYLAWPAIGTPAPAIVVVHENKSLVPYVEDVARRLAEEGYVAQAHVGVGGGEEAVTGEVGSGQIGTVSPELGLRAGQDEVLIGQF